MTPALLTNLIVLGALVEAGEERSGRGRHDGGFEVRPAEGAGRIQRVEPSPMLPPRLVAARPWASSERATSARLLAMAFGQQSGPPASAKQVQELLTLLQHAGHDDFRDARGPMGFTQRQAAGKFTRDEATAFIDRLQEAERAGDAPVAARPAPRLSAFEQALRRMPAEQLAAELQRRGWIVMEP